MRTTLSALAAAIAFAEPIIELREVKTYPERPAPSGEARPSRIMPHIGKKQIAKALKRAAKVSQ